MELLDNDLEKTLNCILDKDINIVNEAVCPKCEIDALIEKGFFDSKNRNSLAGWGYIVTPTHKAIHYFDNKRDYKKSQCREKAKKWIEFGIPVLISIASLTVAILAYCR